MLVRSPERSGNEAYAPGRSIRNQSQEPSLLGGAMTFGPTAFILRYPTHAGLAKKES